jgi:hypothetical protein
MRWSRLPLSAHLRDPSDIIKLLGLHKDNSVCKKPETGDGEGGEAL